MCVLFRPNIAYAKLDESTQVFFPAKPATLLCMVYELAGLFAHCATCPARTGHSVNCKALDALQGISVDENGMIAEGPNMNLGIITHDNEVVVSVVFSKAVIQTICSKHLPVSLV